MELKNRAKVIFDTGFNIAFRSKLISVPVIGSYMDVVYTESIQAIKEIVFQNSLEKLDEEKVDKDYLNSLEFLNLLVRTFEMALNEIETDKVIYYSKLIKNSLESYEEDRRYTFDYINIVHELSIDQMHLLHEIYIQQKNLYKIREEHPEYSVLNLVEKCTDWEKLPQIPYDEETNVETNKVLAFIHKYSEFSSLIVGIDYFNGEDEYIEKYFSMDDAGYFGGKSSDLTKKIVIGYYYGLSGNDLNLFLRDMDLEHLI